MDNLIMEEDILNIFSKYRKRGNHLLFFPPSAHIQDEFKWQLLKKNN